MNENRHVAEAVRDACVRAAQNGYEQAASSGLCHEGALEAAIDAIRLLDLADVVSSIQPRRDPEANEPSISVSAP